MSAHPEMTAVALGAHVLDVLARPVEEIPAGQGGTLVEQIRVPPEGSERVPAFVVEEVVDTSGCGDAFSAGYLRGLSLVASRRRPRCWDRRPPRRWPADSAATPATSTWTALELAGAGARRESA